MSSHRAILSERVKLKYCGITSLEDALDALAARADYLGFVFAVSPRHIDPAAAAEIIAELPAGECRTVGVFKDQSVEEILACVADCPVDVIQVHGDYSLEDLRRIKAESGCLLSLAVFPLPETFEAGLQLAADPCVDYILLDARGEPFDWALCEEAKALGKPVLLAGGLTPSIAALAAANARPYALDVASGIEDSPGRKNPKLMLRFSSGVTSLGAFSADEYNDSAWAHAFTQNGRFGAFAVSHGGAYVPETLIGALEQLETEYRRAIADDDFQRQLGDLLANYAGRPTPLYHAKRLSEELGAQVWLKREDLLHTGAHKLNNCLGQALLAQRMGRQRIVAETGAGQHGVGTATVCALLGLDCVVYMGAEDVERQAPNVQRMKLLGAEVRPVSSGTRTLKDATSEAIRDWVSNVGDTYYLIGSTVGPHPYPSIVREFQRVIGTEARRQILAQTKRLPDAAIACVGGGSNALGLFHGFIFDQSVKLHGAEAGGEGLDGAHAATLTAGRPGVLHGTLSYLLQDAAGQVEPVHSISAGLDYPGVGPEHSFLKDVGRVKYHAITDAEALAAFQQLARLEGILPALESSHALALAARLAAAHKSRRPLQLLVNLSGRGDKDLGIVGRALAESAEVQP